MPTRLSFLAIVSLCFLHGVGGLCFSQEFCVSTPVKLQAALDAAAVNNEA
ncbi:MAG: hypothetical protein JRH05_17430, partial [Deltaproteobacteria bacterium]|nr:hypothetical protein [Deltaproteobacteria bacterium]